MSDLVLLILAGAVATYVTRISGHLILSRFGAIHPRVEAALDAVPTAVLAALVAPSVITRGVPEMLAVAIAALVATRFSMTATVATGVGTVVVMRYLNL